MDEKYTYRFKALNDGYYGIRVISEYTMYTLSVNVYDDDDESIASGYTNDNYLTYIEVEKDNYYSIVVDNTIEYPAENIIGEVYRYDDNIQEYSKLINSTSAISSTINYAGDVDYYTFTNLGGIYDIYSTGYGNGNIDMKAELYLCNPSCTSKVTYNDDYNYIASDANHEKISPIYQGMGNNDFGMRVNLGYENFGKTYMIKVYHYNNTITGNYTINITRGIDDPLPLFDISGNSINYGIKWTLNKDRSYLNDSACNMYHLGSPTLIEQCKVLNQFTISSASGINLVQEYLNDISPNINNNDLIGIIKTGIQEVGYFSVPYIFKAIVNHYGWNLSGYVKALKGLGFLLIVLEANDTITALIGSGILEDFDDLIEYAEDNNLSIIITSHNYEIDIFGTTRDDVFISYQEIYEVEKLINKNFIDTPNVYGFPIVTDNSYLYGELYYITNMGEVEEAIHVYFEQFYGILPW